MIRRANLMGYHHIESMRGNLLQQMLTATRNIVYTDSHYAVNLILWRLHLIDSSISVKTYFFTVCSIFLFLIVAVGFFDDSRNYFISMGHSKSLQRILGLLLMLFIFVYSPFVSPFISWGVKIIFMPLIVFYVHFAFINPRWD